MREIGKILFSPILGQVFIIRWSNFVRAGHWSFWICDAKCFRFPHGARANYLVFPHKKLKAVLTAPRVRKVRDSQIERAQIKTEVELISKHFVNPDGGRSLGLSLQWRTDATLGSKGLTRKTWRSFEWREIKPMEGNLLFHFLRLVWMKECWIQTVFRRFSRWLCTHRSKFTLIASSSC